MEHQANKIAYITGSSQGIGRALCLKLLAEGYRVVGVSRKNDLEDPNFSFVECDLSDISAVSKFRFSALGVHNTLLVNNAGIIGEIGPIGSQSSEEIELVHKVNTIAPQILMNSFVSATKQASGSKHILNISSGAGKYAIDAWGPYCASKAALDLFSQVLKDELHSRGIKVVFVHSVAPGVADRESRDRCRDSRMVFRLGERVGRGEVAR